MGHAIGCGSDGPPKPIPRMVVSAHVDFPIEARSPGAPRARRKALQAAVGAGADCWSTSASTTGTRAFAPGTSSWATCPTSSATCAGGSEELSHIQHAGVPRGDWRAHADALQAIAQAGPDGIIVQDLGILRLGAVVRSIASGSTLPTQMTVASPTACGGRRAGATRVILARELTIPEIARIRAAVDTELEVFVHGALCVVVFRAMPLLEAWGGRSANRGQCAQACRLPYDLMGSTGRRKASRESRVSPFSARSGRVAAESGIDGAGYRRVQRSKGRMKSPELCRNRHDPVTGRRSIRRGERSAAAAGGRAALSPRSSLGGLPPNRDRSSAAA